MIKVGKRPEVSPASRPSQDLNEKRVLTFHDFEYAGSFRPPCGTWTETGLAFRRMKDGTRRLFVNERGIREIEVPPLVKLDGANFAALKTAEVKKVWGDLGISIPKGQDVERVGPNAGFWWDEAKRTLYWTWYHGYWTGGPLPVLGASSTRSGAVTALSIGSWWSGSARNRMPIGSSSARSRRWTRRWRSHRAGSPSSSTIRRASCRP
jgi:hypothetical protein